MKTSKRTLLAGVLGMLMAMFTSARLAGDRGDWREQEAEVEAQTGCATGIMCNCPEGMTRLFIWDIPFTCVPLAIFVAPIVGLTCSRLAVELRPSRL